MSYEELFQKVKEMFGSADVLLKIAGGKLDPVLAFTTGKLKIDGDIDKALKLKEFLKA